MLCTNFVYITLFCLAEDFVCTSEFLVHFFFLFRLLHFIFDGKYVHNVTMLFVHLYKHRVQYFLVSFSSFHFSRGKYVQYNVN